MVTELGRHLNMQLDEHNGKQYGGLQALLQLNTSNRWSGDMDCRACEHSNNGMGASQGRRMYAK